MYGEETRDRGQEEMGGHERGREEELREISSEETQLTEMLCSSCQ